MLPLELAGATYPKTRAETQTIPLPGKSLLAALTGNKFARPEGIYFEHFGNAALRIDDWKIVRTKNSPWELYNLAKDRTELNNVIKSEAERGQQMISQWGVWAKQVGVRQSSKGRKKK